METLDGCISASCIAESEAAGPRPCDDSRAGEWDLLTSRYRL